MLYFSVNLLSIFCVNIIHIFNFYLCISFNKYLIKYLQQYSKYNKVNQEIHVNYLIGLQLYTPFTYDLQLNILIYVK